MLSRLARVLPAYDVDYATRQFAMIPPPAALGSGVAALVLSASAVTVVVRLWRKRGQEKLAASAQSLERMAALSGIGVYRIDLDSGAQVWTPRTFVIYGSSGESPPAIQDMRGVLSDTAFVQFQAVVHNSASSGEPYDIELETSTAHGASRWLHLVGDVELNAGRPSHIVGSIQDITDRKQLQETLRLTKELLVQSEAKFKALLELSPVGFATAARIDSLTGLANRALFMERLQLAVTRVQGATQRSFGVLFLDFDRFKMINDTLGHQSGDALLQKIAERLRDELHAADSCSVDARDNVVSRFGGDEFLVLINELAAPADARDIAERLLNVLAPAYLIDGVEVHTTASIGIVTSDQCHSNAEDVVRNADLAMYEAKHAGRACCMVFNEAMHTRITRHMTIENSLRHAIGTADMYLLYQPIVDIETGRMVSVEALIRWTHPVLGVIAPSEFIPIAEESHLIVALGQWVQFEACRAMVGWRKRDPGNAPTTVSVNISRAELGLGQRLIDQVRRVLEELQLPARCLQLEVTEREVMRHPEAAHAALDALHRLGLKLAMDDFGTGTSSLAFLRNYPFDTVKIDRSFIQDVTCSADVLAVIHATINLVENLGMVSLAEGVEDGAQLALLQSLGCRYAQGYFLSAPVLAEALLDSVRERASESTLAGT